MNKHPGIKHNFGTPTNSPDVTVSSDGAFVSLTLSSAPPFVPATVHLTAEHARTLAATLLGLADDDEDDGEIEITDAADEPTPKGHAEDPGAGS